MPPGSAVAALVGGGEPLSQPGGSGQWWGKATESSCVSLRWDSRRAGLELSGVVGVCRSECGSVLFLFVGDSGEGDILSVFEHRPLFNGKQLVHFLLDLKQTQPTHFPAPWPGAICPPH